MKRTLQIANILGLAATILMNYLSNALPINGKTPGELSDLYPNFFVPAGFTFAIWGVIYLFLIGFAIYQSRGLFSKSVEAPQAVEDIGWWFVLSCLFNIAWLFAWHYEIVPLSVVIMVCLLASLIQIYLRLGIGKKSYTGIPLFLVRVPFSIYLGWISVATIANTTALLVKLGWSGFEGEYLVAIAMIVVATLLGVTMLFRRKDIPYVLVLIWAFFGIYSANKQSTFDVSQQVMVATLIAMAALVVVSISILFRKNSTSIALKVSKKTLRLILGDQLNAQHSWYESVDDTVVYALFEMRQETDYVRHHIQKIIAFFAAMRAFAKYLEAQGHEVIYYRLDDERNTQQLTSNCEQIIAEHAIKNFEYQLPDEYRLDQQLKRFSEKLEQKGINSTAFDTEHFMSGRQALTEFFEGKKTYLMESFYRNMRREYDIMMDGDQPLTGKLELRCRKSKETPC